MPKNPAFIPMEDPINAKEANVIPVNGVGIPVKYVEPLDSTLKRANL